MKAVVLRSRYWTLYLQAFLFVEDIFKNVSVRVDYESLSYAVHMKVAHGVRMGRWDRVQQEMTGQAEASFLTLALLRL